MLRLAGIPHEGSTLQHGAGVLSAKYENSRDFQELATLARGITHLRYAFTYNAVGAVAVRGTDEQMSLTKWLFENLDAASATASGINDEHRVSSSTDEFIRVIYPTHATTPQRLQQTALQIRQ